SKHILGLEYRWDGRTRLDRLTARRGGLRPRPPRDAQPLLRRVTGRIAAHLAGADDEHERRRAADTESEERLAVLVHRHGLGKRPVELLEEGVELLAERAGDGDHRRLPLAREGAHLRQRRLPGAAA